MKMMDDACFISKGIYSKVTNPCPMVMNNNCLYSQKSSCDTNSAYFYMLIKVILEIFKQQQRVQSQLYLMQILLNEIKTYSIPSLVVCLLMLHQFSATFNYRFQYKKTFSFVLIKNFSN